MDCTNLRDDLLDVLYGEATAPALARVEAHVAECSGCRDELRDFRTIRQRLGEWRVPSARAAELAPSRRRVPAGLLAAAALLLAAAGALRISGAEIRYENGSLRARAGRPADAVDLRALVAAQEERHRREIEALKAERAAPPAVRDDEAMLQRVAAMIRASEQRQARRSAASLGEWNARSERMRRMDLARISAGLSYLDGKNGQQAARTTELMGYLMQASDKR